MSTFDEAVSLALRAIRKEGLKLKPEQLQTIRHVHMEKMCFSGCLQGLASRCVTRRSPFVRPQGMKEYSCSSANCSVVVVVSLLASLMIDQVESLRKRRVKAAILSGHNGIPKELQVAEKGLCNCKFHLLFSSPEAISVANK